MEWIVAEGLKKMRKSGKEKKMMMKYLPGTKLVGPAKEAILMEWRSEFVKTLGSTQKKLEKLANGKIKEVDKVTLSVNRKCKQQPRDHDMNKNKKKLVHIECLAQTGNDEDTRPSISQLIKELDEMCQRIGRQDVWQMPMPHNPLSNNDINKQIVPTSKQQLPMQKWQTLTQFLKEQNQTRPDTRLVGDIYKELETKLDQQDADQKKKVAEKNDVIKTKKPTTRVSGTNVVQARQRMRGRMAVKRCQKEEGKEAGKTVNYRFREFKKGGKKHFILVKKRDSCPEQPVEEIFTEWRANLEPIGETPNRRPRVRKLSHRAQRKATLKEAALASPVVSMPLLYADVVKKNLKNGGFTPMEDIFEAWRDYLQELDDLLSEDLSAPVSPEPNVYVNPIESAVVKIKNSVIEMKRKNEAKKNARLEKEVIFASWRFNFSTQPEVEERKKRNRKRIVSYPEDDLFAAWRHNLVEAPLPQYGPEVRDTSPEDYFSSWRRNLYSTHETKRKNSLRLDGEDIFADWLPNLYDEMEEDPEELTDDHRLLKNKKRQLRKSNNLKRKRHF